MTLEDTEILLRKLSYMELFFKKLFFENKPAKVHWTVWDDDLWQQEKIFLRQMVETYGPERFSFLGTGRGDKKIEMKVNSFNAEKPLGSENFISGDMDIAVARVPRYIDAAQMHETINLFYVLSGVYNMEIEGKTYSLKEGNILVLPSYIPWRNFINNDATVVLAVMIKESAFIKCFPSHLADVFSKMFFSEGDVSLNLVNSPVDINLKNAMLNIAALQYDRIDYRNLLMRNIIEYTLLYIYSYYDEDMSIYYYRNKTNKIALQILNFINHNLSSVTLDALAEEFSYSTAHISRILFKLLGKKYKELLIEIRLKKACELLIYTDFSIEKICNNLGYRNPRHLRHLFTKELGVSPSKYREQHQKS